MFKQTFTCSHITGMALFELKLLALCCLGAMILGRAFFFQKEIKVWNQKSLKCKCWRTQKRGHIWQCADDSLFLTRIVMATKWTSMVCWFFVLKSSCALTFSFVEFDSSTSAEPPILIVNVCPQKGRESYIWGRQQLFQFWSNLVGNQSNALMLVGSNRLNLQHIMSQHSRMTKCSVFVYQKLVMHGGPIFRWGLRMVVWSIFGHHGATFMSPHQTTFDWSLHCDSLGLKGSQQKMCIHLHVSSCETCPTCTSCALFCLADFPIQ